MDQAKSVHSTPRRTASKIKAEKPAAPADVSRSEIIEQCVIYHQQLASYDAGFKADATGDSEYAGRGKQIGKAKRALSRLVGLSPACIEGKPPLSAKELHAKATVLSALYGLRQHEDLDPTESAYVRLFAREVEDYLNHSAEG
jgi:hypothetical protein